MFMHFLRQEINFDRFVRGLLFALLLLLLVGLLKYLSAVLIPFLLAWAGAWALFPVVRFLEQRCHLPWRWLSVTLTLLLALLLLGGIGSLLIPLLVEGVVSLKNATLQYLQNPNHPPLVPEWLQHFFAQWGKRTQLEQALRENDVTKILQTTLPHVWNMLLSTVNIVLGVAGSAMGILYLLFLLLDYERFNSGWLALFPVCHRSFLARLSSDLDTGMRNYFRGQMLVALSNALMFAIGFWLIDLPMGIGLGLCVGLISFVPYIQVVGFLPAALLALLQMAETGRSFWGLMLLVLLVYIVVQILQDVFFTPRIMGGITGLSPAIILLSLSVWGYAAGMVGLIVALPLTSIAWSYYKAYVLREK